MLRTSLARAAIPAARATSGRALMPAARRGFLTIVKQGSVAYRLTLGRNPVKLEPGLSLFIPILHSLQKVDMRERALPLERLGAFTSDNVPVTISATAFYRVVDAHRACFDVQDYETSVLAVSTSALRSTIGKFSYDDIIADRNRLNAALVHSVHASVEQWGIQVEKMECQSFHPANENVERQLEQQMEAERNRRKQLLDTQAAINVAEGLKQRTILNSEGELQAKINSAEGDYRATLKQGEALAAQIAAVAKGLAAASVTLNEGPSEQLLVKASDIIIELRRQEMLQSVARGPNNNTYFLHEPMGSGAQIETDNSEKWKRTLLAPRVSSAPSA